AGARSAENEAQPLVLDEPVDLVQQLRDFLDLVQDDRRAQLLGRSREEALAEEGRPLDELQQEVRLEKVERHAVRERRPEVGALPGLPGPPEKRRLPSRQVDVQDAFDSDHSGAY